MVKKAPIKSVVALRCVLVIVHASSNKRSDTKSGVGRKSLDFIGASEGIRTLLRSPILTTICEHQCKSAAAELLIAGDYAIAQARSKIMLHKGDVHPTGNQNPAYVARHREKPIEARI